MRSFYRICMASIVLTSTMFAENHRTETKHKADQIRYGKVLSVQDAGGYRYVEVDENGTKRWIAISRAPVKVGDRIGYDTRTVMENFTSKALGKTFKRIVFVNDLYLPSKPAAPATLKAALQQTQPDAPDEEAYDDSDFVEKPYYTVEEVHRWRKKLNGKTVAVKGHIYKVSRGIMKRDWVHVGDGTGDEQKLTDDLVFTATHVDVKHGDKVVARGKVTVERNFGYGYFYKVLVEEATFEKVD